MGSRRMGRKRLYALNKKGQTSPNTAGAGIEDAIVSSTVRREGHRIITEIAIDLGTSKATIASVADIGDVIGVAAGGAAYLTQLTPAVNGHFTYCEVTCAEVPVGGAIDIDLYAHSSAVLAQAGDASGGVQLVDSDGNWTLGRTDHNVVAHGTAEAPEATDDYYLYLTAGAATAGDFTHGKLVIVIEGVAVPDSI